MIQEILLLQALALAKPPVSGGEAAHLQRTYVQHLAAPPQKVFPLLGPSGEKKWAKGWDPRFVFPPGGGDQAGAVFITPSRGSETVWVLTAFDERRRHVEYVQVTPGVKVALLSVTLEPAAGGRETAAEISYTWTALSERGEEFIAVHRGPAFEERMGEWERQLNSYLKLPKER